MSGRVGYAKRLDDNLAQKFTTLEYINKHDWLEHFDEHVVTSTKSDVYSDEARTDASMDAFAKFRWCH